MTSYKRFRGTDIFYAGAVGHWKNFGDVKLVRVRSLPTGEKRTEHAVLVCTDVGVSAGSVIQTYLDRWAIEVEFKNAKSECGLGKAHVRIYQSIVNYLACSLLAVRLLRIIQQELEHIGWAISRLAESIRFAIPRLVSVVLQRLSIDDLETMISTALSKTFDPETMIQSGVPPSCGT